MVQVALLAALALFNTVSAIPPKHIDIDHLPSSLDANDAQNANASLVEYLQGPIPGLPAVYDSPEFGSSPNQWHIPDVFKRQAVCSNYCGPTQSAPKTYCGCGQICCGSPAGCCATASGSACCANGGCCNTATGAICCGTSSCCLNGATCNGGVCAFKTVVVSRVATSTTVRFEDVSFTITAVGGTATVTATFSSVTVVTVSTADVATIIATATITGGSAKRARDAQEGRPGYISDQPHETSLPPPSGYHMKDIPAKKEEVLAPAITQFPPPPELMRKRQNTNFVSTVTSVVGTTTITSTSTRLVTTTIAAKATVTYSTTIWQTVTSVVNAKSTVTSTTTIIATPGVSIVEPKTVTVSGGGGGGGGGGSGGGGENGGNNGGQNDQPNNVPAGGSKGLSKGAQIGIGAGTAGGSLVICLILGFWCWRRRKTRKERNQEMIDTAVTSAMAAQQQQAQRDSQARTYYDGKHLSTTTSTVSPAPYSPTASPPIHSPQPTYVYPPPPGHNPQPVYNQGPMGFQESGMENQNQYRYSAPGYGGSEIEGSPIQRYELSQVSSPPPGSASPHGSVPHPGGYTAYAPQRTYSDLPEVQRSDLPEVRR